MKERILVTGGTGYIGSHTVVELQNSGYEVIIVDNLSNSRADVVDNIEKITGIRPEFEQVDCLDYAGMDAVFTKYPGIKGIIHFAASKAVGESVQKPLLEKSYFTCGMMCLKTMDLTVLFSKTQMVAHFPLTNSIEQTAMEKLSYKTRKLTYS